MGTIDNKIGVKPSLYLESRTTRVCRACESCSLPWLFCALQRPLSVCMEADTVKGCGECGAYMCSAMGWQDCGQRFYCPFCGKLREGKIYLSCSMSSVLFSAWNRLLFSPCPFSYSPLHNSCSLCFCPSLLCLSLLIVTLSLPCLSLSPSPVFPSVSQLDGSITSQPRE